MSDDQKSVGDDRVPEELLQKLHEDTQAFSTARQHLEATLDDPEPETGKRDRVEAELRQAEGQLEDTTTQIDQVFHKPPVLPAVDSTDPPS